ncbi:LOW QUALITY PROTEIN: esterase-5B-like [Drosophila nasuta]|uniref:LOW QUALITY PROTEIN: esterase-5B-like n=1 Tax=Drosophila nasuta TaxID=42062 RepID=UPI00295EB8CE|nr:LOW QUALITY PROTEIN: esterase-5B-like [Drosophila nasuta]
MDWSSPLLLLWITLVASDPVADPLLVQLPNGQVRGRDNGAYYSYEGIPYAEPPLGELRFESPQPYNRKWKEAFNATKTPAFCIQWSHFVQESDKLLGVEDCLTISVYKPKNATRKVFPVVIEIHGGAFTFTVSSEKSHVNMMANGRVILVRFNYRVGPMGFASTGDNVLPGNYGLKDQRLAMQWIKKNINCFGGDPEQMIVVGLAAGGAAAHLHLLQESFKSVARGVISISGNALDPWVMQQGIQSRTLELGRTLGCGLAKSSVELKKCLKSKEATQVVRAVHQLMVFGFVPFTPFSPVIEPADVPDAFLTQHPIDIIRSGKFSQIPWTVSYTRENGIYNAAELLKRQCDGTEMIYELNSRWLDLAPELLFYRHGNLTIEQMDKRSRDLREQYLGNKNFSVENYSDVERMFTDILFKSGTENAIALHRQYGTSPVYGYVYDNPSDSSFGIWLSNRTDITFGTGIADDYFLMFEHPLRSTLRKDEKRISQNLVKMVEDFVESENNTLVYDSCPFPSSMNKKRFQMMSIRRDCCNLEKVQSD